MMILQFPEMFEAEKPIYGNIMHTGTKRILYQGSNSIQISVRLL